MADRETTIQRFQDPPDTGPYDHLDRAGRLQYLGVEYHDRYQRTGTIADLEIAIQRYQESLNITPDDHPDRERRLQNLAIGYRDRYYKIGMIADLEMAIKRFQEAIDITSDDHPDRAGRLQNLAVGYSDRYRRIGALTDLEIAIQRFYRSLDATPDDHPDRVGRLQHLAIAYSDRYERTGALADLEIAIHRIQEALSVAPDDYPGRSGLLQDLAAIYYNRHRRIGSMEDLHIAIQRYQESLNLTPDDYPDRARRLHNLGIGYHAKYQRTGALADLEISIQQYQEALDITPDDHPGRAGRLSHLAMANSHRYQRIGAMADLEIAIQRFQEAVDATPDDHPERAGQLQCLGAGYHDRYQRTGSIEDLKIAIQRYRESLTMTPDDHLMRARRLQSLGIGYKDRYQQTRAIADLETAIQQFQDSLDRTPMDDPDRAGRLHNLGMGYRDRYLRAGAEADLETAIQLSQDALDRTPHDHPGRAGLLQCLGDEYHDRHQRTGAMADLKMAIQRLHEALNHFPSPIPGRLRSGANLLTLHAKAKDWPLAYQVASTAVSLIPHLTPRALENSDKQHMLTEIYGLASNAAAVALMAGKSPFDAIRLLELGRGVIIGSLSEMRADISALRQKHPQLAQEYIKLRDQLDTPIVSTQRHVDPRHHASQKLEQIIHDIRRLSGFDRFLLALDEDELKAAAASGPIAIINVSDYRCDALIIDKSELGTLRLPHLHIKDIGARIAEIANPESLNIKLLEWLWDNVAEPVLNALGFDESPTESPSVGWPRIWWIPTGPLAKFPIHAAGYHSRDSSGTVLDRVISSYSSSVRALVQSRSRVKTKFGQRPENAVLVGMQELRYAPEETDKLEDLCRSMQLKVRRPQPYLKDVLAALNDCEMFHFAGHGQADSEDPSKSFLVLRDGPLAVANLLGINPDNRNPFLAYLSACGTGQVTHDELIDEGLHLIAACQLAGFRHVIGTLWKVNDRFCVDVATMTYEWMQKLGLSDESVSEGLHYANRSLRTQWVSENTAREVSKPGTGVLEEDLPTTMEQSRLSQDKARDPRDIVSDDDDTPLYWVPYVHFGV